MVRGIRFEIGKIVDGLWYDSDRRIYDPKGLGIVFSIAAGPFVRPIPKFWKPYKLWNTWKDPWFTIRLPFIIGPFISIAYKSYGFYIGLKNHKDKELVLSMTFRKTRWL